MAGKPARSATVKIAGARELELALGRMSRSAGNMAANKEAAKIVAEKARQLAPKLTGRLADSIQPLSSRNKSVVQAGHGLPPYAGPIHFGWQAHNINAQPFLYDALGDKRLAIDGLFTAEVGQMVVRVGRETP